MNCKVAVIKGDGVGPEIIKEGIKVLNKICYKFNHKFDCEYVLAGGCAIDETGETLPDKTVEICRKNEAVLLGAVGGPKWDKCKGDARPEAGLLKLRESLGLFANLRPATIYESIKESSPLRADIVEKGIDFVVVRELTGGIYFGERGRKIIDGVEEAYDVEVYNENEIRRIGRRAFEIARDRKKKLVSIDKANVLESSRLWRGIMENLAKEFDDVELSHMYVDNAAMQVVKDPSQFDVIVTNNIFGDIISDEASMVTGSIGMLPSASLREDSFGMYEPIHGSAPDIAGKDIVNPIATILSVAMMLRHSFNLEDEAKCIEDAVQNVLRKGYRTSDIYNSIGTVVGTKKMGELIVNEI
ncbi:3-isopropylmalate dehydrogenase [Clostridioides sp. ES-S-0049-02]|uniref:3-isopropylmalate dehydrogenase n=1 Tax=Clostridioides sp. ES-S-0049-02 TaxID=2770778 RepID=UPI001D12B40D|nr:3-isopropylmalate dehydrogenase [Clostridioides sp. ES-S-0049-02]